MQIRMYFAAGVLILVAAVSVTWTKAQPPVEPAAATRLNALLKERCKVLQSRVDFLEQSRENGSTDLPTVIEARDELLNAELQMATVPQQRMVIHRQRVDNLQTLEEFTKLRFENGECTHAEILEATAARLQAEIDMLREQA